MSEKPIIGVLALQGAVEPHRAHIEAAGAEFRAVKTPEQFDEVDGFILPGGESTTMLKLIDVFDLWDDLKKQFTKKPVWGICAGCILIAETVTDPAQKSFGLLPISVQRNGYGRQLDSHHATIAGYEVSLIRAPLITDAKNVTVKADYQGAPVWVEKGQYMATTFHPELTFDTPSPMHTEFVRLVREKGI
jgi:5'-phosphate synthase pdxT subunit